MPLGVGKRQVPAQIALETHALVQAGGRNDLAEVDAVKDQHAFDRFFDVEPDGGRLQPDRTTGAHHRGLLKGQMITEDLQAEVDIGQRHTQFRLRQMNCLARRRMQRRKGIEDDLSGQALRRPGGAKEAHPDAIG